MVAWRMKGTVVLACNCEVGCPCNFNGRPTHGNCEGGWAWKIEEGVYGETKLDGLCLELFANWPAAIHEGNGVAMSLIDEHADDAQGQALTTLVQGGAGGPWGIFRKTFTRFNGPARVRFDVETGTLLPRVKIGDVLELETEHIRNPVTQETVHPRMVLPEGLVLKEGALLRSRVFRLRNEHVAFDHPGRYAAAAHFQYFGA